MKHTKWEYRIEYRKGGTNLLNELHDLGKNGWELCGIVGTVQGDGGLTHTWPNVIRYHFKRPILTK